MTALMPEPLDTGGFATRGAAADALAHLDARLAASPDDLALQQERAACLELLGRRFDALESYLEVLRRAPGNAAALRGAGSLLAVTSPDRARALLGSAVALHPRDPALRTALGSALAAAGDAEAARAQYAAAIECDAGFAPAHFGLADLLEAAGDAAGADARRHLGWAARPLVLIPSTGEGAPIRVLLLGTAHAGNQVTDDYLDPERFAIFALLVDYFPPTRPLPAHDIVVNAVCDADASPAALAAAAHLLGRTDAAVINHPRAVAATGRAEIARRFSGVPGVRTPRIVRMTRAALEDANTLATLAGHGVRAPFLLRSLGFHAGEHFEAVAAGEALPRVLAALPGDDFFAIEYLESRDPAGLYRKYRVMTIGGVLHPVHLALARHWKVHLFSAGMDDDDALRAQDEAFLRDPREALGARPWRALETIAGSLALDFAALDFALDADRNVLLFEANAAAYVPPPLPGPQWEYRRAHVERVHRAVRAMIERRANGYAR